MSVSVSWQCVCDWDKLYTNSDFFLLCVSLHFVYYLHWIYTFDENRSTMKNVMFQSNGCVQVTPNNEFDIVYHSSEFALGRMTFTYILRARKKNWYTIIRSWKMSWWHGNSWRMGQNKYLKSKKVLFSLTDSKNFFYRTLYKYRTVILTNARYICWTIWMEFVSAHHKINFLKHFKCSSVSCGVFFCHSFN